jgi:hypothetical protein
MLKVARHDIGFRVSVSETGLGNFGIDCRTAEQAAKCVLHYYGSQHQVGSDPECPFCQKANVEDRKASRKSRSQQA